MAQDDKGKKRSELITKKGIAGNKESKK